MSRWDDGMMGVVIDESASCGRVEIMRRERIVSCTNAEHLVKKAKQIEEKRSRKEKRR